MDLPLALFPIDGEEEQSGGRRMVDGSVQNQKVGAKLADGKCPAITDYLSVTLFYDFILMVV